MLGDCIGTLKEWVITGWAKSGSRPGLRLPGISGSNDGPKMVTIAISSTNCYNGKMVKTHNIVIEEEELERLKQQAKRCGVSFGEFLRLCIRYGEPHVVARLGDVPKVTNIMEKSAISNK